MRNLKRQSFTSNPNKDFLRAGYDRDLISMWQQERGAPLQYLGLPGPEMLDIIEWQEFIGQFTTIERLENEQHRLFLRANVADVEHRLHSLYGEFDRILLTGRDVYQVTPRWPYDLINLDFFGGFIYRDGSRPKAIRKLLENQSTHQRSFLLIITHDLRDGDSGGEKASFLDGLAVRIGRDFGSASTLQEFIRAYKDERLPDAARQALFMNTFLRDHGEGSHFRVRSRPAVIYSGTGGTVMIHYVTEFHYHHSVHRAVSEQSLRDVLNLGVLRLSQGQFSPIAVPLFA